jgi:SPP1 gp7 family putative phage head morphogenesis protein
MTVDPFDLIDQSDDELKLEEAAILLVVFDAIEKAFHRLQKRIAVALRTGQFRVVTTGTQLYQLFAPLAPGGSDVLLRAAQTLLTKSTKKGLDLAAVLTKPVTQSPIAVTIPRSALELEAKRVREYLFRHTESFAIKAEEIITEGVANGHSVEKMTENLRRRTNVLKSRAEMVVRTESCRAHFQAKMTYLKANGFKLVIYYATPDERTCPYCAAQSGRIFKLEAFPSLPRHPYCRCAVVPYSTNPYATSSPYDVARKAHRNEVLSYAKSRGVRLNEGPAAFELSDPLPFRKDGKDR